MVAKETRTTFLGSERGKGMRFACCFRSCVQTHTEVGWKPRRINEVALGHKVGKRPGDNHPIETVWGIDAGDASSNGQVDEGENAPEANVQKSSGDAVGGSLGAWKTPTVRSLR